MGSWKSLQNMQSAWRAAINPGLHFLCANPSNQRLNDLFYHNGVSLKSTKKASSRLFVTLKGNEETFGYGLMTRIAYMCHIYDWKSVKEKETFE